MDKNRRPDVLSWLVVGVYSEAFPCAIILLGTLLVRGGKFDPEDLQNFLSFSVPLAIAFSILMVTVGNLLFAGYYPGHWAVIVGILIGSFLIAFMAIGSRQAVIFGGHIEWPILISWFLFQIAISLLVLSYCAMLISFVFEARNSQHSQEPSDSNAHAANGTTSAHRDEKTVSPTDDET